MSKVKLLVVEGNGSNYSPYIGGTEKVLHTTIELPEHLNIVQVIRCDFEADKNGNRRASDDIQPIITLDHMNSLVGKVLTIIDATFTDPEQRKASKDLLKETMYNWYMSQGEAFTDTWRRDKFPNYARAFDEFSENVSTDAQGNR